MAVTLSGSSTGALAEYLCGVSRWCLTFVEKGWVPARSILKESGTNCMLVLFYLTSELHSVTSPDSVTVSHISQPHSREKTEKKSQAGLKITLANRNCFPHTVEEPRPGDVEFSTEWLTETAHSRSEN